MLLRLCAVRRIGRGARVFRAARERRADRVGALPLERNPLYLAAALMLCGLGLIAGAGWTAVALLPATLLAYTPVVLAEERALAELFGDDYARYLAQRAALDRVPRRPRDAGWRARVGWREVFRREKRLVPGMLAAILAIVALRSEWIPAARRSPSALELATGRRSDGARGRARRSSRSPSTRSRWSCTSGGAARARAARAHAAIR